MLHAASHAIVEQSACQAGELAGTAPAPVPSVGGRRAAGAPTAEQAGKPAVERAHLVARRRMVAAAGLEACSDGVPEPETPGFPRPAPGGCDTHLSRPGVTGKRDHGRPAGAARGPDTAGGAGRRGGRGAGWAPPAASRPRRCHRAAPRRARLLGVGDAVGGVCPVAGPQGREPRASSVERRRRASRAHGASGRGSRRTPPEGPGGGVVGGDGRRAPGGKGSRRGCPPAAARSPSAPSRARRRSLEAAHLRKHVDEWSTGRRPRDGCTPRRAAIAGICEGSTPLALVVLDLDLSKHREIAGGRRTATPRRRGRPTLPAHARSRSSAARRRQARCGFDRRAAGSARSCRGPTGPCAAAAWRRQRRVDALRLPRAIATARAGARSAASSVVPR